MKRYTLSLLFLLGCCIAKAQTADVDIRVKDLPDTVLSESRSLLIPEPFDGIKVLRKLFPGEYYDLESSGYKGRLISWGCKTCKRDKYTDVNGVEEDPVFPFEEGVATRLINVLDISDSAGSRYKILTFNHSYYDADGMQTGRFSGGLLGLAKFSSTDKGWLMRSFDPAVAAYGAFSNCPEPKAIRIGKDQYAFLIDHRNGGAGGPYDRACFLVAGLNGAYKQVLAAYGCGRSQAEDTQSDWDSEVTVPDSDKKYFRDIVIRTKGRYIVADTDVRIEEIDKQMKGRKSCKFSFSRRYVYTVSKGYQAGPVAELVLTDKR